MPALLQLPESEIYYRVWPCSEPRAAVLLVHGLGAHSARFEPLARALTAAQLTVYAIELQGFGERAQPPGHIDSFDRYASAIVTLAGFITSELPGKGIFLAGDSMGGLIAFNLAAKDPAPWAGLILLSPAFASLLKFPLLTYATVLLSLLFSPRKTVPLPFNSAMCTQDSAIQEQMDADPRELRVASAGLLIQIVLASTRSAGRAKQVRLPVVAFTAGQDQFVDVRVTQERMQAVAGSDKTVFHYPDQRHALYVDLGRQRLFADLTAWLERRV